MNKRFMLVVFSLSMIYSSSSVYAVSDAECAIWLCLPAGFPTGCGDAKNAFKKRVRKGKSPLPAFSSCAVSEPQNPYFNTEHPKILESYGSYIPAHKSCIKWLGRNCLTLQTAPEHYSLKTCTAYRTAYPTTNIFGDLKCYPRRTITLIQAGHIIGEPFYY